MRHLVTKLKHNNCMNDPLRHKKLIKNQIKLSKLIYDKTFTNKKPRKNWKFSNSDALGWSVWKILIICRIFSKFFCGVQDRSYSCCALCCHYWIRIETCSINSNDETRSMWWWYVVYYIHIGKKDRAKWRKERKKVNALYILLVRCMFSWEIGS